MLLLQEFQQYILNQNLLTTDAETTLLAVSGGVDSVVLAHLFRESGLPFAIAHCNYGLRGDDSDADEALVVSMAEKWGVVFHVKRFETSAYAAGNGISIQMAARDLRYGWLGEVVQEQGYAQVATAHHLNDSVETALFNFARGTGLKGLSGLAPRRLMEAWGAAFTLVRPLLFARKADLLQYAHERRLEWREDRSNAADTYSRNFIRHHIVPPFEAINPDFLNTAERNLAGILQDHDNLDFLWRHWLNVADGNRAVQKITTSKLALLPHPERILRLWMKNFGFDAEQARQVASGLNNTGLELQSASGWRLLVDREELVLQSPDTVEPAQEVLFHADDLMLRLPDGGTIFQMPFEAEEAIPDGKAAVVVDVEKLIFPLKLRHWQPGDVFQPFGMGGKRQKLQDFFTNQKMSRFEKEQVWVMLNGNEEVIWVLGRRQDERYGWSGDERGGRKIIWRSG
jgi:tRNA(Ile)-lysidine synthase